MSQNIKYLLNTGSNSIIEDRNSIKIKNKKFNVVNNSFVLPNNILKGSFTTRVSIDGKTLLEESPNLVVVNNVEYYSIDSGDYFSTKDFNDENVIFLIGNYIDGSLVTVDNKEYDSGAFSFQSETGVDIFSNQTINEVTGNIEFDQPLNVDDFFDRWDLFFDGYLVNQNEYENLNDKTGLAFAYKKDLDLTEFTGNNYDYNGEYFIPSQNDLYINGEEQRKALSLELFSGVKSIVTGVSCEINITEEKTNSFKI